MNYNELKKMARTKGMPNVNKSTAAEMREFLSAKKPKSAAKQIKVVKPKTSKGAKVLNEKIKDDKTMADASKTIAGWIRELHEAGKSYENIKEITGLIEGHYVSDVLWRINNKK